MSDNFLTSLFFKLRNLRAQIVLFRLVPNLVLHTQFLKAVILFQKCRKCLFDHGVSIGHFRLQVVIIKNWILFGGRFEHVFFKP